MKTTFTEEAIRDLPDATLGQIIRDRVAKGVRTFDVVGIDEAIGRLAASGVRVLGNLPAPVEVESRYPAPTPEEVDELLAEIAGCGYASEAVESVERWMEKRYGVVGAYTATVRSETALRNVEPVPQLAPEKVRALLRGKLERGEATIDSSMVDA